MTLGTLYLIPVPLGPNAPAAVLPRPVIEQLQSLNFFVVESGKTARAILKAAGHPAPIASLGIQELNEHTDRRSIPNLLTPLLNGSDIGLMSDAGCPGIADPGAALVALAHEQGITVRPMVGPSSIVLALMGSGLQGQQFCFRGYLPAREPDRSSEIQRIERLSAQEGSSQIFIETPYRNAQLFDALVRTCRPDTRLTVATDLSLDSEEIRTDTIGGWTHGLTGKTSGHLDRRPTVFLIEAALVKPRSKKLPRT
jgi:16S rRNA (cytidine1402-2'-O)-methyltransferase